MTETFEGREVLGVKAIVRKTGDGLSAAQEVEPVTFSVGDKVYAVAELVCKKVRFDDVPAEIDDEGDEITPAGLYRVQDYDCLGMTFVDGIVADNVAALIHEMQAKVRAKRELEKSGQQSFAEEDPDDPALTPEELELLGQDLDGINVTKDAGDRRRWIETVLDESPLRLRHTHAAALREEIERLREAEAIFVTPLVPVS